MSDTELLLLIVCVSLFLGCVWVNALATRPPRIRRAGKRRSLWRL